MGCDDVTKNGETYDYAMAQMALAMGTLFSKNAKKRANHKWLALLSFTKTYFSVVNMFWNSAFEIINFM